MFAGLPSQPWKADRLQRVRASTAAVGSWAPTHRVWKTASISRCPPSPSTDPQILSVPSSFMFPEFDQFLGGLCLNQCSLQREALLSTASIGTNRWTKLPALAGAMWFCGGGEEGGSPWSLQPPCSWSSGVGVEEVFLLVFPSGFCSPCGLSWSCGSSVYVMHLSHGSFQSLGFFLE